MDAVPITQRSADFAVGEADHRIANSLAAISNLARLEARDASAATSVERVRQILLDASGRIETVARLHRLLAQSNGKAVPAAEFLRDVCTAMGSIAANHQVSATVECSDD